MPLPIADCATDISTDVCCDTLFDVADRIRLIATTAVEACFTEQCSDRPWRSYVSVGTQAVDYNGDCLVVTMGRIQPVPSSDTGRSTLPIVVFEADFRVDLLETGWPTIHTDFTPEGEVAQIYLPESDLVNAVARHSYAHGEAMYRSLADRVAKRTLVNNIAGNFAQPRIAALEPAVSGQLAGWTTTIRIQIQFPPGSVAS